MHAHAMAVLIRGILGDLNLTGAQQKLVPDVVRKNLLAIEGDASERPPVEGTARRAS